MVKAVEFFCWYLLLICKGSVINMFDIFLKEKFRLIGLAFYRIT